MNYSYCLFLSSKRCLPLIVKTAHKLKGKCYVPNRNPMVLLFSQSRPASGHEVLWNKMLSARWRSWRLKSDNHCLISQRPWVAVLPFIPLMKQWSARPDSPHTRALLSNRSVAIQRKSILYGLPQASQVAAWIPIGCLKRIHICFSRPQKSSAPKGLIVP